MKLGGLFSGIGGFELAWQRNGGEVAWMCEIDPAARKVLEARFPGVPVYPDVSQLDPAEVEPVDVLTGGSPCQGFSIAGARTGLEHVESRLFADYVRVMEGLAERGLSWAVWENVPGVLSISNDDGERTFPHVVAALVGADEPVHLNGGTRWNTGLADRGDRAVAWRVVDSRHFGVPQRRRRVYACVAFGGVAADRAGRALLAVPEGVSGDPAACRTAREDAPAGARVGAAVCFSAAGHGGYEHGVGTLRAAGGDNGGGSKVLAVDPFVPDVARTLKARADGSYSVDGLGPDIIATSSATDVLTSEGYTQPITGRNGDPGSVLVPTLMTMREGKDGGGKGPLLSEDESLTLATGNDQVLSEPQGVTAKGNGEAYLTPEAPSLSSADGMPGQGYSAALTEYGVRRLTPVECERLQGFPPVLEWKVDEMTRDELCASVLAAGYVTVDTDTGRCWRTRGPGGHTLAEPKELTGSNVSGYLAAKLTMGDVKKQVRLHRLVWIAAHGIPEPGLVINHLNGDKTDNRLANLELVTSAENSSHAADSGLYLTGEDNPACKSGPEVWRQVCEDYRQPEHTIYTLAEKYGLSKSRIHQIVTEHGWTEPAGSDSARYRALGNAVTVNVPAWLFARMKEVAA